MIALRSFVLDDGMDVVTAWYTKNAKWPRVRVPLDTRMFHLRQQHREGWTRKYYDTLRADGVGEIRWKVYKVHHRWLGFFGPKRNEFTFLLHATKTNAWNPRDAIQQAEHRRRIVEADPSRSTLLNRWGQKC